MTPPVNDALKLPTAPASAPPSGNATQRLEQSRERMRRYMLRTAAGDSERQSAARSKRQVWIGVALAVALVMAWQQPWRRASGVARAVAFVIAGLKVPGLLSTLTSQVEGLMAWWRTFSQTPSAQPDTADAAETASASEPLAQSASQTDPRPFPQATNPTQRSSFSAH